MHFYSVYLRYATYWQNNYCCMFIINTAKTEYLVTVLNFFWNSDCNWIQTKGTFLYIF